MKLKSLVAALALVGAASANAAVLDNGSTAPGNGGVFFNVWDANGSYTRNLNIDLNTFESTVAAGGFTQMLFNADALLTSFLSGRTTFNWNIMAIDSNVSGGVRVLEAANAAGTFSPKASNVVRTASSQGTTLVNAVNAGLTLSDSAVFTTADAGYVGKAAGGVATINSNIGFAVNTLGTQANDSFASGLSLIEARGNSSGTLTVANLTLGGSNSVRAYVDTNDTLHITAAVPEPETYAMLLAGLGMIGFMARRRINVA